MNATSAVRAFTDHINSREKAPHLFEDPARKSRWADAITKLGITDEHQRRVVETVFDTQAMVWGNRFRGVDLGSKNPQELMEAATESGVIGSEYLPAFLGAAMNTWRGLVIPEITDVQPIPNGGTEGRIFVLGSAFETDRAGLYSDGTTTDPYSGNFSIDSIKRDDGGTATTIKPTTVSYLVEAFEHKLASDTTYKLNAAWQAQYGEALTPYMLREMAGFMAAILNYAFLNDLNAALAAGHKKTWYTTPPTSDVYGGENRESYKRSLYDSIVDADNGVATTWGRRTNTIVTDETGTDYFLKMDTGSAVNPGDFSQDAGFRTAVTNGTLDEYGSHFVGLYRNRWRVFRVYKTPAVGEMYLAAKGPKFKTGAVFAPSRMLDTLQDMAASTWIKTDSIMALLGWKIVNANCYAKVTPTAR